MIVLDNSVLSAFTRLNLIKELKELKSDIYVTPDILREYTKKWIEKLPNWISIKSPKSEFIKLKSKLSKSDISILNLASN